VARKKKKSEENIDGNTFRQEFQNSKFIQEYAEWKDNVQAISGEDMGVVNIDTLWDFLIVHVFENIREGSVNQGRDGEGTIAALEAIESVIEGESLTILNVMEIKKAAETLEKLKDGTLDPRLILFTEKEYDDNGDVIDTTNLRGHYRTDKYVKRRKAAGSKGELPAVDSGWYSGSGNPPHWAVFGGNTKYAKPRGLLEIMKDISTEVGKEGKNIFIEDLDIQNLKGKNAAQRVAGLSEVEKYFNKVIKNEAFWNAGGRLLVSKVAKDFAAQEFRITPREQTLVRILSGIGVGKDSKAGTIRTVKFSGTALPIIQLVDSALIRAQKKTAPNGYRAWQNARRTGFDYRKTAREKYGPDTKNPNTKVISKRWQEHLWK